MNWISVKDKLPEIDSPVLAVEMDTFNDKDILIARLITGNIWYAPFFRPRNITHWMPLPEPPTHSDEVLEMVYKASDYSDAFLIKNPS